MAETGPAPSPGPVRRALAAAGAPLVGVALGAPLVTAVAWALARGDGLALLDARVFRAWTAALALSLGCAAASAALQRRWAVVAAASGLLAVAAQSEVTRLWRFEGVASVGEGEATPRWRTTSPGPLAATPEIGTVEFEPGDAVTVRAAGEGVRIALGTTRSLRGVAITLREVGAAPSFAIRAPDGVLFEEGLVELSAREPGYIEVPSLPHRFYFSAASGPTRPDGFPERLRIRVQRGKLQVLDAVLEPGVVGEFEGLGISWAEGTRWALLEVRRAPRPLLAVAGLALVVEGALAAWLLRRKA